MKRRLIYTVLAALFVTGSIGIAVAGEIISWGGNISKGSITYYTYDAFNNLVANRVSFAKPKGVDTPNTVLYTRDSDGPQPLVNMSIVSNVNGRFYLVTKGDLLTDSRGASGHTEGYGVILLDDTLNYDYWTDTFIGDGRALSFNCAVDVAATAKEKSGSISGSSRLTVHPTQVSLMNLVGGVDDGSGYSARAVMKAFSLRFENIWLATEPINYTDFAGDWSYMYAIVNASDSTNPDIGLIQTGTLTINVDSNGDASFDVPGSSCSTTYSGVMQGATMALSTGYESSITGPGCDGNGQAVFTFPDSSQGGGSIFVMDPQDGSWTEAVIILSR